MLHADLTAPAYRDGDHGAVYLIEGPSSDLGVVLLRPGDSVPNHLHHHCDETFIVLEGSATLWIDGRERHTLEVDHVHRCEAGEMHLLVNDGDVTFRSVFFKSPSSPGDTVVVPWEPGTPPPPPQARPQPTKDARPTS